MEALAAVHLVHFSLGQVNSNALHFALGVTKKKKNNCATILILILYNLETLQTAFLVETLQKRQKTFSG